MTQVVIKVEPIVNNHIEPYMPSPIHMNFTLHEEEEECIIHGPTTLLKEVLDYLLDEWDNDF